MPEVYPYTSLFYLDLYNNTEKKKFLKQHKSIYAYNVMLLTNIISLFHLDNGKLNYASPKEVFLKKYSFVVVKKQIPLAVKNSSGQTYLKWIFLDFNTHIHVISIYNFNILAA